MASLPAGTYKLLISWQDSQQVGCSDVALRPGQVTTVRVLWFTL